MSLTRFAGLGKSGTSRMEALILSTVTAGIRRSPCAAPSGGAAPVPVFPTGGRVPERRGAFCPLLRAFGFRRLSRSAFPESGVRAEEAAKTRRPTHHEA